MVDQELCIDTEHFIEKFLIIIFIFFSNRAPRNISHRIHSLLDEPFGVTASHAPEIGDRAVVPQGFPIGNFIQLRDARAGLVRFHVFCHDVHCDFCKIQVRADAGGRGDTGLLVNFTHHGGYHLAGGHIAGFQIVGDIQHDFVDGIDVNVLRREVVQINAVDARAAVHVVCHARGSDDEIDGERRILGQFHGIAGASKKRVSRRFFQPLPVDIAHALDHFKQTGTARDTQCP